MAERYPLGVGRIFYRAKVFATGRTVTMDILNPSLKWMEGIKLMEIGEGLYYIDFNFAMKGTYMAIFYEGGEKVISQNFFVNYEPAREHLAGGSFRGSFVINI